jgi:hypothetical protein
MCEMWRIGRFLGSSPRRLTLPGIRATFVAMKRLIVALMLAIAGTGWGYSQIAPKPLPVFDVHKPTIVAFFPHVTDAEMESNPDTNEVLGDFQLYAGAASKPLREAGIDFQSADTRSFTIRSGSKVRTFHTGKIGIGYYFIAPGKKPHVEYGVMVDADILDVASKYFGIAIKR